MCITEDGQYVVTAGTDGGVFSWHSGSLKVSRESAPAPILPITIRAEVLEGLETIVEPQSNAALFAEKGGGRRESVVAGESDGRTSSSKMQENQLTAKREQLVKALDVFKKVFQGVLKRNDESTDLEKLELSEFAVDLEMRDTLIQRGATQVQRTREELTLEFEGKEYIKSLIEDTCYRSMEVKGKLFRSFKSGKEVHNFPVRTLSAAENTKLAQVRMQRQVQLMEHQWVRETRKPGETVLSDTYAPLTERCEYVLNVEGYGLIPLQSTSSLYY